MGPDTRAKLLSSEANGEPSLKLVGGACWGILGASFCTAGNEVDGIAFLPGLLGLDTLVGVWASARRLYSSNRALLSATEILGDI